MTDINHKLFERMKGVKLDVGCGQNKQPGCLGIDRCALPGVDIVHDIQEFPWPVPDDSCTMVVMSHVWEHVEPRYRSRLMDELWRIMRYDGQLFIACPYANSFLANAHPEHYMCPNEATFQFYDPDYPLFISGSYERVQPWKIVRNDPNLSGCIEIVLEPRKTKRGKPCLPKRRRYLTAATPPSRKKQAPATPPPPPARTAPQATRETVLPNVEILRSGAEGNPRKRLLVATPTLGTIRMEWAVLRYGQVIPCNWTSHDVNIGVGHTVPMHYLVADAQNLAVEQAVTQNYEWLLLWEDDVIAPPDLYTQLDPYITDAEIPVVSGLYFLKADRSEPIVYRGHGTRCFTNFKLGDVFWVDGVPTGMLLIHRSILEIMYAESETYTTLGGRPSRRVFETPTKVVREPQTGHWSRLRGTSDLAWCRRVIEENVLARAGWPEIARKRYPFAVDARMLCRHIDLSTGRQYPSEEILNRYRG